MHFAPLITLSGIALSGVPMISSKTFADASIRFRDIRLIFVVCPPNQPSRRIANKCSAPGDILSKFFSSFVPLSVLHVSTCYSQLRHISIAGRHLVPSRIWQ